MAAVCVSGTVTNDDQCAYIKIETLRRKTPTEIHSSLMEVCGVETIELKSQSSEWRGKSSPRPKKFKRAQSNMKQMMIFAYDCKGVILTDRVPSGTTVTAAYYRQFLQKLRRKMHANRPDLLEKGVLMLHDNARPHLVRMSVNCWTDTAGTCYPILPTAPT